MKIDKYRSFNDSLKSDFNDIFSRTESLWSKIKNKNFFLTGCTGFFGYWILKSFLKANQEFKLNSQAYVLTRKKNLKQNPIHKLCSDPSIIFYKGDIRNFKYPRKKFEFIIHGATTTASETFNKQDPLEKSSILIDGTKNILRFAKYCGCKNFLFLSSGAVYGNQPLNLKRISEHSNLAPKTDDKNFDLSVLGEVKRVAELLTTIYSEKKYFNTKIARCFSFVGPLIPLNIHYAIGNFLQKAILKKEIKINSTGKSVRSYMYMTDLTIWLWYILFKGKNSGIYNVGSEEEVKVKDLAKIINSLTNNNKKISYKKIKKNTKISRYIPSTSKIRKEFKINQKIKLKQSIIKTYQNILKNRDFYEI